MNRRASTSFHTQRHSAGGSRGTTPHRSHSFASRNNHYSYSRAGNNAKNNTTPVDDEDPHLATLKSNWKVPLVPPSSRYSLAGGFQAYPTSTTAPTTASTTARRGSRSSTQSARHSSARSSSASTNNSTSRTSASARREAAAAAKAAATPPLRPPRRLPRCARCGRRFGSASILIHQARCNGGGGDSSLDDDDCGFNTDFSLGAGWRRPWVGVAETQRTGRSSATSRLGHSSDRDRDGGGSAASSAAAAEPGLPSPFAHYHDAG